MELYKQNKDLLVIERPLYNKINFENDFTKKSKYIGYEPVKDLKKTISRHCFCGIDCVKKQVYNRIPIIKWLKSYNIKDYLLRDILTGITVGVMHIPQGKLSRFLK
jgi:hypothetical protein